MGTCRRLLAAKAFFNISTSIRGIPSSVKPAAPASKSLSNSTSSFPCCPLVTLVQVSTWMSVSFPLFNTSLRVSSLSTVGLVFAISTTVVKPPRAAAFAPLAMSSLYSNPGSLKCTWTSTSPGATIRPSPSIICSSF